jgi:transcriptional regulator with XRE-family HTH domain
MKNDLEIGNRIRNIRESLRYSREVFSELINISESFLSQIERGEKSISLKTLMSISSVSGFSTDYILFGSAENNTTIKKINTFLLNKPDKILTLIYNIVRSISAYDDERNI